MGKGRLETFSDGVLAIIITIMVLELKVPHGNDLHALNVIVPVLISYILSFVNIGIYWNNHHHLMQLVEKVNGKVMWANMFLIFWLSLVPFASGWMGENNFTSWPVAVYGFVLVMAGVGYFILSKSLIVLHGDDSKLAEALRKEGKEKISVLIYLAGMGLAFVQPWIGFGLYALVSLMWLIPDKRIEKKMVQEESKNIHPE